MGKIPAIILLGLISSSFHGIKNVWARNAPVAMRFYKHLKIQTADTCVYLQDNGNTYIFSLSLVFISILPDLFPSPVFFA